MPILPALNDSHELVIDSHDDLVERLKPLGEILSLEEWLEVAASHDPVTTEDMGFIIDQILMIISEIYVHLNMKRVRRAVDTKQALRILAQKVDDSLDHMQFHAEIQKILKKLGDIHTAYRLPSPFINSIAFLPILMQKCYYPLKKGTKGKKTKKSKPKFIVTNTLWKCADCSIMVGDEVISWNGIPISRAVDIQGTTVEGSNPEADRAFALQSMTMRWLGATFVPDSPWIMVGIKRNGCEHEIKLSWRVLLLKQAAGMVTRAQYLWQLFNQFNPAEAGFEAEGETEPDNALNHASQIAHLISKEIFTPEKIDTPEEEKELDSRLMQLSSLDVKTGKRSALKKFTNEMPKVGLGAEQALGDSHKIKRTPVPVNLKFAFLEAWEIQHGEKDLYGYIRIRAFPPTALIPDECFVMEINRLLAILPRQGMILDVRGNPGGSIRKAESILQLFAPRNIETFKFQFIASEITSKIVDSNPVFEPYRDSLDLAMQTGYQYSKGIPITKNTANDLGQMYFGPVVLLTSATSYSASDFFSASFADHNIGDIIGVDSTTGGGGANAWTYSDLKGYIPDETKPDEDGGSWPNSIGLQFAARVALRFHENLGMPIEEIGVHPTIDYALSEDDLLFDDVDLIDFSIDKLAKQKCYDFSVDLERSGEKLDIKIESVNVSHVVMLRNGMFILAVDIDDNITEFSLEGVKSGDTLELHGYSKLEKKPSNPKLDLKVVNYRHKVEV